MKRIAVALLVVVVACGGSPIQEATNCTELEDRATVVLADMEAESDAWWDQIEEVDERAKELDCPDNLAPRIAASYIEPVFEMDADGNLVPIED